MAEPRRKRAVRKTTLAERKVRLEWLMDQLTREPWSAKLRGEYMKRYDIVHSCAYADYNEALKRLTELEGTVEPADERADFLRRLRAAQAIAFKKNDMRGLNGLMNTEARVLGLFETRPLVAVQVNQGQAPEPLRMQQAGEDAAARRRAELEQQGEDLLMIAQAAVVEESIESQPGVLPFAHPVPKESAS